MGREPDLYAALGVPSDASPAEIAHAYRRLVRAHHPDTRSDSEESAAAAPLHEIVAAYEVLRDPDPSPPGSMRPGAAFLRTQVGAQVHRGAVGAGFDVDVSREMTHQGQAAAAVTGLP